ncbi:MAG: hypothetical protein REI94_04745 [Moraxellaceae bacterium]|nr:hypothetical protein [Moraxellaceae bacterium]
MAGGLNKSFINNPTGFMASNFIHVPVGAGGGALMQGVSQFGLTTIGGGGCILGNFASNSYFAHPIHAFFLLANPNAYNTQVLPLNADVMFTNHLNGCQFLAYGPDRNNVTVEHNNWLNGPASNYTNRAAAIAGAGHGFFFQLRPGIEYNVMDGANVVGVRGPGGWQFYVRHDANANPGPVTGPH